MAFGTWIRAKREEADIMLIDFARDIKISPAYWSRIERGLEKAPKDQLIISACERLGLGTDRAFIEAQRLPPDMQDDISVAVSVCLLDLKLARLAHDPTHEDSAVDVCGYAALLRELTQTTNTEGH